MRKFQIFLFISTTTKGFATEKFKGILNHYNLIMLPCHLSRPQKSRTILCLNLLGLDNKLHMNILYMCKKRKTIAYIKCITGHFTSQYER